jgi:hypothetical protein
MEKLFVSEEKSFIGSANFDKLDRYLMDIFRLIFDRETQALS